MMRKMYISIWVALSAALIGAAAASGDTLTLRNGEVSTGALVYIADGIMMFRTTLAGQMLVNLDQVQALATDSEVILSVDGAPATPGRLVVENGVTRLKDAQGKLSEPIEIPSISQASPRPNALSPKPEPRRSVKPVSGLDVETGVLWRTGNKDTTDLFARLSLTYEARDYVLDTDLLLDRADASDFPRMLRADIEWRLQPGSSVQPFAALEVERDTLAALQTRGTLSLGVGRTLLSEAAQSLSIDLAAGATRAAYDASLAANAKPEYSLWGERLDLLDRDELHARLRLRYAKLLFGNSLLEEDLRLYPSLTNLGEFRASSESSLLVPFTPWINLRLHLMLDYESQPEFQLDHWRTTVGAGIDVHF